MSWAGSVPASEWGYSGDEGPANWADIDDDYEMCGLGKNQSPIDLDGFVEAELAQLKMDYQAGAADIVFNGHAVQADYAPGSKLTVDGRSFELKQFHFHSPSENHVKGQSYPLEAHLVHSDAKGTLAVVSVMFKEGAANGLVGQLWPKISSTVGEKVPLAGGDNVTGILPQSRDHYRYNGSLTTPPCSEGVWWFVMKNPMTVSADQIATFQKVLGFANNRPIQPTNARPVLQ
jgi:carbonic anhydrase